jgi:hypothetical protein
MPIYPNGFVAGTNLITSRGPINIEDLKPGDMIQVQPDHQVQPKHRGDDVQQLDPERN